MTVFIIVDYNNLLFRHGRVFIALLVYYFPLCIRKKPSSNTFYTQLRKQSTLKMSPQLVSLRNEFTTTSKIGQKETYLLLDAESFWWIPLEVAEDVLREK